MFDLKYYNQVAKYAKFHNEYKGNALSRQNIHRLYNNRYRNNNHVFDTLINDLPDNDLLKNTIKSVYEKSGQTGLVYLSEKLNELH